MLATAKGPKSAEVGLIAAYQACFGRGDHSELVLADLAVHLGFFQAEDRGLTIEEANFQNGRRSAFLHILQHLTLPEAELEGLVEAARREAASYEPPGS
ncbi:hypothetical protein N8D56_21280 [Devosia sp. A8/3-2]|nr:hypothetical protein N8D56_21280 [Devosia sp. A8/3-2]